MRERQLDACVTHRHARIEMTPGKTGRPLRSSARRPALLETIPGKPWRPPRSSAYRPALVADHPPNHAGAGAIRARRREPFHLADKGPMHDTDSPALIGTVTKQRLLSPSESQAQTFLCLLCQDVQRYSPAPHCLQRCGAA